ncbi:MAG: hypothetical protein ABR599_06795 [Gemmatimonadota bacterium]
MSSTTSTALVLLYAFAAAACARDAQDGEEVAPADTAVSATTEAEAASALGAGGADAVTYEATDFAFEGPAQIAAGVMSVRMANAGSVVHHVQLLRLEGEHSAADLQAALSGKGPDPEFPDWATPVGGPGAVLPGETTAATVRLEPGRHAAVCMIPVPDGVPHVAKGMALDVEVVAADGNEATLPEADATIGLRDYAFHMPAPIASGSRTLRVTNGGTEPHELQLFRMEPGKRLGDMMAWAQGGFQGPPPATPLGGVTGIAPDAEATFTADLEPGVYALVCFLPGPDGKLHLQLGMASEFEVG